MEFLIKIFYAILLFWIWFSIIKYRKIVKSWSGNFVWAEQTLWRGSTYLIIIILWLFLMLLWVLWPFWWLEVLFWTAVSKETLINWQINK